LREAFTPVFEEILGDLKMPNSRERIFPTEVVVFAEVSSILSRDSSLASAVCLVNQERVLKGLEPASINTASFSAARSKLPIEIFPLLARGLAEKSDDLCEASDFWNGLNPYAIDGTTISALDTSENQKVFPQHGQQQEGVGFPILRVVLLQNLTTGMIEDLDFSRFKGKQTGEMSLARNLLSSLPTNSILLGDRYFPSFFFLSNMLKCGIQGLFPAHAARDIDFRMGTSIGQKDHIISWKKPPKPKEMSWLEYDAYPEEIKVREVDLSKETGYKDFVVVTTLLDSTFSKSKLAKMYKKRWKIELALRDLKETFGMNILKGQTPEMVVKLLWAHVLAYNILRWHMLNVCDLFRCQMDGLSVAVSARVVSMALPATILLSGHFLESAFASFYYSITTITVGLREGRKEPRAVKKRPKPFPRLHEARSDWHKRKSLLN
jgi:hypothetical protein